MRTRFFGLKSVAVMALAAGAMVSAVPAANAAPVDDAAPAASFWLCNLRVWDTEDVTGPDEVYLKRPGVFWGPKTMNNGDLRAVNVSVPSGTVISAWDQDTGSAVDKDDWIGSNTITRTGIYTFQADDAKYDLSVRTSC
ncbi:hypothetical protein HPO96_20985 [Kribbella sandramycini]|uniref:Uncharacterized protein n=1 Tax=Kribbella sandramycini TaxID=60450 RepID=A0A7Y4P241_9ACTN|nr:hypothetical protein [Kribbella sandramycini]MBB6566621.1 hypothetical protein [Kribbella sandramycini]NOL42724.1 hypothetical protein [Kribbella sandramycini]